MEHEVEDDEAVIDEDEEDEDEGASKKKGKKRVNEVYIVKIIFHIKHTSYKYQI